jgi:voltage-gated potassium channel
MSVESVESRESSAARQRSNAYEIFILVLTVFSLLIMVALLLPLSPATIKLLTIYDNLICIVFLIDFGLNMARSHPKRGYFIGKRGWLDLIGSIPTFNFLRFGSLLRLARISRLTRVTRLLRGKKKRQLIDDVVKHRGQYAAFITVLLAILVLSISSVLVLQFESKSPTANITTGGQALWWSVVTITTVGYGDFYPVTTAGRITGVFVMFSGVGIIGALASILASVLVPPPDTEEESDAGPGTGRTVQEELEQVRLELVALRQLIAVDRGDPPGA